MWGPGWVIRNPAFLFCPTTGDHYAKDTTQQVMGFHSYSLRLHVIHLNQELDDPMLQFVCAHELGHTILHPDINTAFMTHRTFFSASKLEREANTFAVELLLPDDFIRENEGRSIYQLARLRGVPEKLAELKMGV
ncbi:MAG: ImmA/IrrE family metallo-endopeptidase [Anaerovibrio sp.]|uniref:ImmA/IrrE family metallo-endopeptidase n=1 Tax=Anaerovibrio sp. TaxID=1872532 RepID=UPI00260C633D|nr:ImmA/IrrE family metallo-endopeptidase [Anaerovibrio sp.]MDD7678133.1 ImmA/IrrE family metallo-endopeptidase [Anaerovibrio sp.]MDY2603317.1 ImmA/IrrE family metallo-endopeptidase [Anaerovibrio sp.]